MKKQVASVLLAVCLSLALAVPAWAAAASVSADEAAQVVNALGIMVGDANGNMNLSSRVTRAEFVTMAVKAAPGGEQIGQAATSPYPDVPRTHWASGYVEAGVAAGLISGYTDGTFRPSNQINLAEGVTIVLQLLGYGPSDFSGAYPTGQLAMYRSLKLDRGVTAAAAASPLTRQDAMYLFYNLMTADTKDGVPYLTTLGYELNGAGEIDLVALINGAMEGPVTVQGDWKSAIPFDLSRAVVYQGGKTIRLSDIQDRDVVYWNRSMNALWVYRDKVTGTIQALEPSASSPTAVTVAGRTCAIETSAAAYSLSDLGQYGLGDTVTLLLGRDGAVTAVVDGAAAAASASEQVGLVTAVAEESYSDGKGGTYTARTVTLLATDGQTYHYECKSGLKEGSLAQAVVSNRGEVTLRALNASSLSGTVNSSGTKVGRVAFAEDVEILDVSGKYGIRIYPSRLAGVDLSGSLVKYCSLNGSGEIDRLILSGVTGDMYQYGVLTKITGLDEEEDNGYYSYQFDIGGVTGSASGTVRYPVSTTGPVQLKGTPEDPEGLYALTSAKSGTIYGNQFAAGSQKYTLSDNVLVYEYRSGTYYLSSLARVQDGEFTLTGWYDKTDANGGRIRVIVAREP